MRAETVSLQSTGSGFVWRRLWASVLVLGIWLLPVPAQAHGLTASYTAITVTTDRLDVVCSFDLVDVAFHFHLDTNGDTHITADELRAAAPALFEFVEQHLTLTLDGSAVTLTRGHATLTRDASKREFVNLASSRPLLAQPAEMSVTSDVGAFELFGQAYTNLVKVALDGQVQQAVLSLGNLRQSFLLGRKPPLLAQLRQFTVLGIKHIFLGYDHLMFLLALIVIGGRLLNLIKIVTAFTVAHSITLILAALQIVTLPPRLIESGIALSIAYVAAENCFAARVDHRWVITFYFGLVHGFGFANVLRQLGLPSRGLVSSLLAFNVGVELGQMAIVALLFPITLWLAKQRFRRHVIIGLSSVILCFGTGWFIERAFHLSFMPF